jgi:hypothetical protein
MSNVAYAYVIAAAGMRQPPEERPVRVTVQMYRSRRMDTDGRFGACKPIFDALVELYWAYDDGPQWMEQQVPPVIIDWRHPRTEIEIVPLVDLAGGRLSSGAKRGETNGGVAGFLPRALKKPTLSSSSRGQGLIFAAACRSLPQPAAACRSSPHVNNSVENLSRR